MTHLRKFVIVREQASCTFTLKHKLMYRFKVNALYHNSASMMHLLSLPQQHNGSAPAIYRALPCGYRPAPLLIMNAYLKQQTNSLDGHFKLLLFRSQLGQVSVCFDAQFLLKLLKVTLLPFFASSTCWFRHSFPAILMLHLLLSFDCFSNEFVSSIFSN